MRVGGGRRTRKQTHTKSRAEQPKVNVYDYLLIVLLFKCSFYVFVYECGKTLERCY